MIVSREIAYLNNLTYIACHGHIAEFKLKQSVQRRQIYKAGEY